MTGELLDDRYRLEHPLRSEGALTVWQAVDTRMERPVAVRLIDAEQLGEDGLAAYRALVTRLATVAHPNLIPIYDLRLDAEPRYVVEALIEGETAAKQLRAGWRLAPGDVAEIAEQLASALAAVHRLGLHHGEISPASVVIDTNRTGYLTGFGEGAAGDPAADAHALAEVIYSLLCGEAPGGDAPMALDRLAGDAPKPLRKAILAGLNGDAADAAALLARLQEESYEIESVAAPDLGKTQVMPRIAEPPRRPEPVVVTPQPAPARSSGGGGALLALLILALIGGAVYVAVKNPFGGTRLPAVAGMSEAEAKAVLAELGLEPVTVGSENSDTVPGGQVLRSSPPAGSRVRDGGQVQLTLSAGPRYVTVPSLQGLTADRAKQTLLKFGLSVGRTETAHQRDVESGIVVAQSPPAGERVDKGSLVTIHVNEQPSEPAGIVEELTGRAEEAVREQVDELGERAGEAARTWAEEQSERLKERTREMGRDLRERAVEGVGNAIDNLREGEPPPLEEPGN